MLLVDMSRSHLFGTAGQLKRELAAEVCATLAFSAIRNNDKVGLICFTDQIERFVPAKKGTRHVLRVIRELLYHEPQGRGTDIAAAIEHLNRVTTRRSVVFLVSDFQAADYESSLRVARRRHDVIPITIVDPREMSLPNVRFVELTDAETGESVVVDTSSMRLRTTYSTRATEGAEARRRTFRSMDVESVEVTTGESFVDPLTRFFRARESRL